MLHFERNGVSIPRLGYGTYQVTGDRVAGAIETALEAGYRHIDTAAMYGNEREIGAALKAVALPRDEIFLTTKVWLDEVERDRVDSAVDESLSRLGVDHVDLLLLHWPVRGMEIARQVAPLAGIKASGRARLVGVSNYTVAQMRDAISASEVPLDVLQCEYHPELDQDPLLDVVRGEGMLFTSYSPLGQGGAMGAEVIRQIAQAHGKDPGQVVLRWHLQQDNVAAIPKAASDGHIRSNIDVFDFELSDREMQAITALRRPDGRIVDPGFAPDWDTGVAA